VVLTTLHLHLGAHKTGSTIVQKTFQEAFASGNVEGIAYVPLSQMRRNVTPLLLGSVKRIALLKRVDLRPCQQFLTTALGSSPAILLSDENLLGGLGDFMRVPGMYPRAGEHLSRLVGMFSGEPEVVIYLCIRDYPGWLESVYLQILKKAKVRLPSFDEFMANIQLDSVSWLSLCRRLLRAVPGSRIVLWCYQDFAADNQTVIDGIAGEIGIAGMRVTSERGNSSLSKLAHGLLMSAKRDGVRPEDIPRLVRFVKSRFSVRRGYSKPSLMEPSYSIPLLERYASDVSSLRALEEVDCLGR
jgi:hypothetical protein